MTDCQLKTLCIQTARLAIETGKWIRQCQTDFHEGLVEVKSHNSLVSYVDQTAEERLIKALLKLLPNADILGEEGGAVDNRQTYKWIIDPLDGTTNFIHGLPNFAVSIALAQKDELILGVVYEAAMDECFYAWKKGGAWCNGKPIHCTGVTKLRESLLATGFPYVDFRGQQSYMTIFTTLMQQTRGLRRLGSAATDLAYVACGRFDGFFEYGLAPWDVAAGAVLVREAGGQVTDFYGGNNFVYGQELVAAAPGIFEAFLDITKSNWQPEL
jgi:myo-inositol-1(or 4)-monophosphatase